MNRRPEYRWLRRQLYSLMRLYPATFEFSRAEPSVDFKVGTKSTLQQVVHIRRGCALPTHSVRRMATAASLIPFRYGGNYDSRSRTFIVNRRDIPKDFVVDLKVRITYDGKRWEAKDVQEFEVAEALMVVASYLDGAPSGVNVDERVSQSIAINGGAS